MKGDLTRIFTGPSCTGVIHSMVQTKGLLKQKFINWFTKVWMVWLMVTVKMTTAMHLLQWQTGEQIRNEIRLQFNARQSSTTKLQLSSVTLICKLHGDIPKYPCALAMNIHKQNSVYFESQRSCIISNWRNFKYLYNFELRTFRFWSRWHTNVPPCFNMILRYNFICML